MNDTLTGTVYKVREENYTRKDGQVIPQRGIIVRVREITHAGRTFDDYIKLRASGPELAGQADALREGDRVTLRYALSGTLIADRETQEPGGDCFTRVTCLEIL